MELAMEKRNYFQLFLLAGVVMSLLAACQEPFHVKKGSQLRFKVTAHGEAATKTAYSGDIISGKERIDWSANDKIRIYSSDKNQVGTSDNNDFYDYTIAEATHDDGSVISKATLAGVAQGSGLVWLNDPYGVTIYGAYPPLADVSYYTYTLNNINKSELAAFNKMTIPSTQELKWSKVTNEGVTTVIGAADMTHAYMLARPTQFEANSSNEPEVTLDFYPVFNAFYIVLASQDNEIELNSLELVSTSNYLAGEYQYSLFSVSNNIRTDYFATGAPSPSGVGHTGNSDNYVLHVDFPDDTKISTTDSVKVTILARPPQPGATLTNLTLKVNHSGNKTSSLELRKSGTNGEFFKIDAFKKARLTGVAMKGAWTITFDVDVEDWDYSNSTITLPI